MPRHDSEKVWQQLCPSAGRLQRVCQLPKHERREEEERRRDRGVHPVGGRRDRGLRRRRRRRRLSGPTERPLDGVLPPLVLGIALKRLCRNRMK